MKKRKRDKGTERKLSMDRQRNQNPFGGLSRRNWKIYEIYICCVSGILSSFLVYKEVGK
jgi:hypothetical protein